MVGQVNHFILSVDNIVSLCPSHHFVPHPFIGLVEQTILDVSPLLHLLTMIGNEFFRIYHSLEIPIQTTN
jgi:hypothetical protein